jgi:hypothetical protein
MSLSTGLGGSPFTSAYYRRRRRLRTLPLTKQLFWANVDDAEDTILNDWLWGANVFATARGQYAADQVTPITIGATITDGISSNVWLEADVATGTPMSDTVSLSVENDLLPSSFNGVANATTTLKTFKEPALLASRRGSNMVYDVKNKRYIVFGGYDGTARNNEVWELSADSAYHRWKKINPSGTPPTAKNLAAAVYVRGTTSGAVDKAYMVIWGGATPSDNNDMHSLDLTTPGSESWTTISQTNIPAVRSYLIHHMAAKSTASNTTDIYLFGGWGATRTNDLLRCTFNVNSPGSVTWTTLKADGTSGNPTGRSGTGMIYDSVNDRLIIMGGYTGSTYLADVWQYSISAGTFTQITPTGTAPGGRELHSIGYDPVNRRAIIMGGWQGAVGSNRNDVIQLSLTSGSEAWTTIKANDLSNQGIIAFSSGSSAVDTANNRMIVSTMNAYDTTNKYVYAFNMNDTSATAPVYSLTIVDFFRARDAPATVYNSTRSEVLFINGYSAMDDDITISEGEHVSELWAYDRTNNTLRYAAKGPYNMPQNEGGLVVYDSVNDRVIYFGGLTGVAQKTNDVWELKADIHGMYKARKLTPTGTKPAQRWLMAGCYDVTNQRLVLWGGQGTSGVLSDMWALSLVNGSEVWTQLTPTGTAPTAVWQPGSAYDSANKRLYIHAGCTDFADSTYSSQLFYLDVSTTNCSWTDTGVTGGLAVRGSSLGYDASTQRLTCFGGYGAGAVNNTLRYTSTASFTSWTTQVVDNVPAARRSASYTVVNGSMIVACGRPVTGQWFNDIQELNVSATPSAWKWTQRSPRLYQMLAIPLTALAAGSYHWQAWSTSNVVSSPSSFGGNAESSADYIIFSATSGQIKIYNGSTWVWKPVKVWNGASWATKTLRYWDGTAWRPYAAGASSVSIDAIGPSSTGAVVGNATTLSWSHTCSGTNRYLVVGITAGTGQAAWTTTVTCNGSAMTSLGKQQSDNQSDGYVQLFGIIPPVGACAIVATTSSAAQPMIGGSISATGVDQTTPVRSTLAAYGDGTSIQVTPTGASGDLFIDAACCGSGILTSNQTLQVLKNYNYSSAAGNMAMSTAPGAASAAMGYTCESDWWGVIGISLRASGT